MFGSIVVVVFVDVSVVVVVELSALAMVEVSVLFELELGMLVVLDSAVDVVLLLVSLELLIVGNKLSALVALELVYNAVLVKIEGLSVEVEINGSLSLSVFQNLIVLSKLPLAKYPLFNTASAET